MLVFFLSMYFSLSLELLILDSALHPRSVLPFFILIVQHLQWMFLNSSYNTNVPLSVPESDAASVQIQPASRGCASSRNREWLWFRKSREGPEHRHLPKAPLAFLTCFSSWKLLPKRICTCFSLHLCSIPLLLPNRHSPLWGRGHSSYEGE